MSCRSCLVAAGERFFVERVAGSFVSSFVNSAFGAEHWAAWRC